MSGWVQRISTLLEELSPALLGKQKQVKFCYRSYYYIILIVKFYLRRLTRERNLIFSRHKHMFLICGLDLSRRLVCAWQLSQTSEYAKKVTISLLILLQNEHFLPYWFKYW
jgi:hypothetical protein